MAINELSSYGEDAIQYLNEIMTITTYDEIKAACKEAIKTIREKNKVKNNCQQKPSQELEEQEAASTTEFDPTVTKLADLPP